MPNDRAHKSNRSEQFTFLDYLLWLAPFVQPLGDAVQTVKSQIGRTASAEPVTGLLRVPDKHCFIESPLASRSHLHDNTPAPACQAPIPERSNAPPRPNIRLWMKTIISISCTIRSNRLPIITSPNSRLNPENKRSTSRASLGSSSLPPSPIIALQPPVAQHSISLLQTV